MLREAYTSGITKLGSAVYSTTQAGSQTTYSNIGGRSVSVGRFDIGNGNSEYRSGLAILSETKDAFDRVTQSVARISGNSYQSKIDYTYLAGDATNKTTHFVATMKNNYSGSSLQYAYTYDNNGNIATVKENSVLKQTYTYDALNQLTRADDAYQNKSFVYAYNTGGNITSVKQYAYTTGTLGTVVSTINYTYGDATWKDKLTNYNGTAITYDAIGNPLSYRDGMSFTWKNGRQLKTLTKSGTTMTYTYGFDGLRTYKSNNAGVAMKYNYSSDGTLLSITDNFGSSTLWFIYDENGSPVGFDKINGSTTETHYYVKNVQGDITGLTDKSGTLLFEYKYDAWGKPLNTPTAGSVAELNPLRYRGYVYDAESGMYYCQSRYYDPTVGRFINADETEMLMSSMLTDNVLEVNLFSYCGNNPVNNSDPTGYSFDLRFGKIYRVGRGKYEVNVTITGTSLITSVYVVVTIVSYSLFKNKMKTLGVGVLRIPSFKGTLFKTHYNVMTIYAIGTGLSIMMGVATVNGKFCYAIGYIWLS